MAPIRRKLVLLGVCFKSKQSTIDIKTPGKEKEETLRNIV